jgi:hypothetical protein
VEAELGRAAQEPADASRILDARELHEDALGAHALDRRLGDADLVDALSDDLEALLHRGVDPVAHRLLGQRDPDLPGRYRRHRQVGAAAAERHPADRHRKPLQRADGVRLLRGVLQHEDNGVVPALHGCRVDAGLVQRAADLAEEALHPPLHQRAGVDLKHEVRAAAQVEAERDLLLGEPAGKLGERGLREKVRQCRDEAEEDDRDIGREQPA